MNTLIGFKIDENDLKKEEFRKSYLILKKQVRRKNCKDFEQRKSEFDKMKKIVGGLN